jgi:hypothetical protein
MKGERFGSRRASENEAGFVRNAAERGLDRTSESSPVGFKRKSRQMTFESRYV